MDTEKELQKAESLLKEFTLSSSRPDVNRLDVVIDRKNIKAAVKALHAGKWGYLSAITGLDNAQYSVDETTREKVLIPDGGSLELLYIFCHGDAITNVRVAIPYADPNIDTICDIISSVTLYEREAAELFGINFSDTPSSQHLVLPDNWPDGVYPLRKSFTGFEKK